MNLSSMPIHFIAPHAMYPNEHHDTAHADKLASSMLDSGLWRVPIVLERTSLAVMDGHHRLAAARALGLSRVPALLLDYHEVEVVAARDGFVVTPEAIVARSRTRDLYPMKTTRHLFPSPVPACNVSLWLCR